jgi:hypothetical protein
MTVLSGPGPTVEKRTFKVNNNYTWDLEVNVVKVNVEAPTAPIASFSKGTPQDGGNLLYNGILRKWIQGVKPAIPPAVPAVPALQAAAKVTLVGAGPDGNRGVSRMMVGFIQNCVGFNDRGTYDGGGVLISDLNGSISSQAPVLDADPATQSPWYGIDQNGSIMDGAAVKTKEITVFDTPSEGPPLTLEMGPAVAAGDHVLRSVELQFDFTLDLCVQTKDTQQQADQVYTRRATAAWSLNGNGSIGAASPWTWQPGAGAGVTSPNAWTQIQDGTEPGAKGGTRLNALLPAQRFV